MVAESFDGAYKFHIAEVGTTKAVCGKPLMQGVVELPLSTWGKGQGYYCKVCERIVEVLALPASAKETPKCHT